MAFYQGKKLQFNTFDECVKSLQHLATPDTNDQRYNKYVTYINAFLSYFGKEKTSVAGSTAEETKLRTEKYGGDTDFLVISGAFDVPEDLLKYHPKCPRYVRIRGESFKRFLGGIELVDGKFLPSSILKEIGPELFSVLRGFFRIITSDADSVPGRETRVVTTGEPMKVGRARYEYRNLNVDERFLPKRPKLRKQVFESKPPNDQQATSSCGENKGVDTMKRLMELIGGNHNGQFLHFAYILKLVTGQDKKKPVHQESKEDVAGINVDESAPTITKATASSVRQNPDQSSFSKRKVEEDVLATCSSFTSKDFVPTIRVTGRLPCMLDWTKMDRKWPCKDVVEAILKSEMYIVARLAPVDGDADKDFCLSFNRPEILLAKAMSETQRNCLLLLKAFHNGVLKDLAIKFRESEDIKLTTYHLKTALYHVSENAESDMWVEENLQEALLTVVSFLIDAIEQGRLNHFFFRKHNLFMGMADVYRTEMKRAFEAIKEAVLKSLQAFFTREDNFGDKPVQVHLSEEAVNALLKMKDDGGVTQEMGDVDEAMEDFRRGFELGPKNSKGEPPIDEAINATVKVYMEEEAKKALMKLMTPVSRSPSMYSAQPSTSSQNPADPLQAVFASVVSYANTSDGQDRERIKDNILLQGATASLENLLKGFRR